MLQIKKVVKIYLNLLSAKKIFKFSLNLSYRAYNIFSMIIKLITAKTLFEFFIWIYYFILIIVLRYC